MHYADLLFRRLTIARRRYAESIRIAQNWNGKSEKQIRYEARIRERLREEWNRALDNMLAA
jgi:hypothetical protein